MPYHCVKWYMPFFVRCSFLINNGRQTDKTHWQTYFVFVCRLGISLITWLLHTPHKFHHPIPPNIISVPPHYISYQQIRTYTQLLNTQSPYLAVHLISVIAQSLQPPHQWYHPVHPSHQYLHPIATSEHVPTPNPSIHPISTITQSIQPSHQYHQPLIHPHQYHHPIHTST